ncbi:serine protease [Bosea caraganae]|uniref:Serine protease n=1 Tax=Bosea caraganae TaxID=2763117 RepID=A0A370L0I0_9HYPH|nr:serine protease [Bosea caraganae]RDJ20779.1 serine protease [Bosea caraganae]RDJ21609.1 serine protease [Bosea caraganae]
MANALSFRSRRGPMWFAGFGLAMPLLVASLLSAAAQAPAPAAPAPNPQMVAAQSAFDALPEAERRAIQTDLIWAGAFNGAVSGSFGPLTFRGINTIKAATRGAPDGILNPVERRALAQRAAAARDAAGFRLIADERTGARIGIPSKLLPKRDVSPNGGRWQSEDGRVTLDTSTTPPGGDTLDILFERATSAVVQGRKITYKLLRPDFFVITGETATGKFYRRLSSGPAGLRGFSIGYDKALTPVVDPMVIAIAASFEPFPTGPMPAAAPAVASASGATPAPGSQPAVPPPVARATERYGAGLIVGDRLVLTATAAIDPCKALRVGGRAAKLRAKDDASGLALLDVDGISGAAPGLRGEALGEQAGLVLVAYGNTGGQRAAMALPGQGVKVGSGAAVFAPLQPGQVGSPAFDRQGRLAGLVTADPSDKFLVAGVAPQRAYAVADGAAIGPFLSKAGVTLPTAAAAVELSTGAVVDKAGKAVLQIVCTL